MSLANEDPENAGTELPEENAEAAPEKDDDEEAAPRSRERLVVFFRHGIAEDRSEDKADEDRSLTKEGHSKMKKNAAGLAATVSKADVILTSPLLRAVQTALWISKAYKRKVEIKTTDALAPEASFEDVKNLLDEMPGRKLILVGHEPTLTRNMRMLTKLGTEGELELKKGGCYGVRVDENGNATLEWVLTPRLLKKLS